MLLKKNKSNYPIEESSDTEKEKLIRELLEENEKLKKENQNYFEQLQNNKDKERYFFIIIDYLLDLLRHADKAGTQYYSSMQEIGSKLDVLNKTMQSVRQSIIDSVEFANKLHELLFNIVSKIHKEVDADIQEITSDLESRIKKIDSVLKMLNNVSSKTSMLALNASIEAARSGEQGEGFTIIADEMQKLASQAANNSKEIFNYIQLSDFHKSFQHFQNSLTNNLAKLSTDIQNTSEKQLNLLKNAEDNLVVIKKFSEMWKEFLKLNVFMERMKFKVNWSMQIGNEMQNNSKHHEIKKENFEKILKFCNISYHRNYDRLDDILTRGTVRIAIEPSLIGLSFRLKPGSPLIGLDVEYATAFAKWLGVKPEFIESPWDLCTEVLEVGKSIQEPEADLMWSALPPDESYKGVAFSKSYTYLYFVLARRLGDEQIQSLRDLDGKILGCTNDPVAFATLEKVGVRWSANSSKPDGKIFLGNLIAYPDQTRIHDCLADGTVDAFVVDLPVYYWACTSPDSPWKGKIEIISKNIAYRPWHYAVGSNSSASSYRLLCKVNEFIEEYKKTKEREQTELKWQGQVIEGTHNYSDEPGNLLGEEDLKKMYESR